MIDTVRLRSIESALDDARRGLLVWRYADGLAMIDDLRWLAAVVRSYSEAEKDLRSAVRVLLAGVTFDD